MNQAFKQKVYEEYTKLLNEKISSLQQVLNDLAQTGANETKSTAGDKHETALAMLQIEQANKRAHLQELLSQKAILNRINAAVATARVVTGSLVKTNSNCFFVSVALGRITVEGMSIIALSAQSPIGKMLMGLQPGDHISFKETDHWIEWIF